MIVSHWIISFKVVQFILTVNIVIVACLSFLEVQFGLCYFWMDCVISTMITQVEIFIGGGLCFIGTVMREGWMKATVAY